MATTIPENEIRDGAKKFEMFWLRPSKLAGQEAIVQVELTKNWNGWKLKDELVESIGLTIGDTINTEVKVLHGPGLMDETDDTDLFADGEGADWLLDHEVGYGSIINAKVKFVYSKAPVGGINGKEVWKVSLVFIEGYDIVREKLGDDIEQSRNDAFQALKHLLQ